MIEVKMTKDGAFNMQIEGPLKNVIIELAMINYSFYERMLEPNGMSYDAYECFLTEAMAQIHEEYQDKPLTDEETD